MSGHIVVVEQHGRFWVVSCKECAWVTGRDTREEAEALAQEHRDGNR